VADGRGQWWLMAVVADGIWWWPMVADGGWGMTLTLTDAWWVMIILAGHFSIDATTNAFSLIGHKLTMMGINTIGNGVSWSVSPSLGVMMLVVLVVQVGVVPACLVANGDHYFGFLFAKDHYFLMDSLAAAPVVHPHTPGGELLKLLTDDASGGDTGSCVLPQSPLCSV
jgi:hypothetical protein